MKKLIDYGIRNGHNIGIIMKEMVRRAIILIRNQRFIFEAEVKKGYDGKWDDVVTTADNLAQDMYIRLIKENFPGYGILAEENKLKITCTYQDHNVWFTVDPLCGTKAFARRQSHGIGTMISLVLDGEIIAAYVGDIMTQEIFGFRPGSEKVWRISEYERYGRLVIDAEKPFKEQYVVLTDSPYNHSAFVQLLLKEKDKAGLFRSFTMADGSIGITMARLWKGEAGAAIFSPRKDTPWDLSPVAGICKKMGFIFIAIDTPDKNALTAEVSVIEMPVLTDIQQRDFTLLVLHKSRLDEFMEWKKFVENVNWIDV